MNNYNLNEENLILKKNNNILKFIVAILIIVIAAITTYLLYPKEKIELVIDKLNYNESTKTGCRTIKVNEEESVKEYSFDNGKTWQKSNYTIICENKKVKILGRNKKQKVIAEGSIKIDDLEKNYPSIKVDFENALKQFNSENLLFGVNASSDNEDISENLIIESLFYKDDKIIISYSITDEEGRKTIVEREAKRTEVDFNLISFEKRNYVCNVGDKLKTKIKAISNTEETVRVSKYDSIDKSIVNISKDEENILKTPNEIAVVIDCKTSGRTTITAESSTGAKTKANIVVREVIDIRDKISFEKNSYTCNVGERISTTIKVSSVINKGATVSTYSSLNSDIVTINKHPNIVLKTPNELAVVIDCKKEGKTELTAKSSTGATTKVPIEVTKKTEFKETISFAKTSYTCYVGERISTTIKATSDTNKGVTISSYTSNNKNIATISKNPNLAIKTPNQLAVVIDCKKEGTTTINSKSSTGATTSVKVVVKEKNTTQSTEKVNYEKTSYTCKVGEEIETIISATSDTNKGVTISSYTSNNQNIATVAKNPKLVIKTPSQLAVVISCKSAGTTTLTAKSSTGATTSVKVTVSPSDKEKISFEKSSYSCNVGDIIKTKITAVSEIDMMVNISTYTSNNQNIASITRDPNIIIKSPNAKAVIIECKSKGTTTLNASSSTGATTKVSITVN